MRRSRRFRGRGLIKFGDVHYTGTNGADSDAVLVHGDELHGLFQELASVHHVDTADLLGNVSIGENEPLSCILKVQQPSGWSFRKDSEGYICLKLRKSRIPVGHSLQGYACDGGEWTEDNSPAAQVISQGAEMGDQTSTPLRDKRQRRAPNPYGEWSTSPGSPGDDHAGTQEYTVRLHRAAGLAASKDPESDSKRPMLHICGNKDCMVVAHYRSGTESDNEADKVHHQGQPENGRTSRASHPAWQ